MTPLAQVHAAHWDANQAGCVCGDKSAPQGPLWHEHVAAAISAAATERVVALRDRWLAEVGPNPRWINELTDALSEATP